MEGGSYNPVQDFLNKAGSSVQVPDVPLASTENVDTPVTAAVETPAPVVQTPETPVVVVPAPAVETPAPVVNTEPVPEVPVASAPVFEIDDAAVMQYLAKKTGKEITSLDEFIAPKPLTAEEQAAKAEALRNNAIAYGLQNNIFGRADLEAYAAEAAKDPRETVFQLFAADLKAKNTEITDEQIAEQFADYTYENAEDGNPLKEMQRAQMQAIHNNVIASKYGAILDIDNTYAVHQQTVKEASDYAANLTNVFNALSKDGEAYDMKFEVDGAEYAYQVTPDVLNSIKGNYQSEQMFNSLKAMGAKPEALKELVAATLIYQEFPKILAEVAKSHKAAAILEYEAKLAAVPSGNVTGGTSTQQHSATIVELPRVVQDFIDRAKAN